MLNAEGFQGPDSIHHDKGFYTWSRLRSICVFHEGVNRNKTADELHVRLVVWFVALPLFL